MKQYLSTEGGNFKLDRVFQQQQQQQQTVFMPKRIFGTKRYLCSFMRVNPFSTPVFN